MVGVKGMIGLQICVTQSIVQSRLGGVHGSGATIQYQTRPLAAQCKPASAFVSHGRRHRRRERFINPPELHLPDRFLASALFSYQTSQDARQGLTCGEE